MMQWVECVPNFSEGRDQDVIQAITKAISQVEGVLLLHVDSNPDANRTVMTFIGEPESAGEAAFQAVAEATRRIDMSRHQGVHPRLGAADVCPFVPLLDVNNEECIRLAWAVGERVGQELEIPVYFYGEAATSPDRRELANIRRGGYESLGQKLTEEGWKPDKGPAVFNPRTGATMIGVRGILIAFNVCLNTNDPSPADEIASIVREKGRIAYDSDGQIMRDKEGRAIHQRGTLKTCRAIGWKIPQYNCSQISLNLDNFLETPPHIALEEVRRQASQRGLEVIGSELVGMIPLQAMLMAGQYYSQTDPLPSTNERELVGVAIRSMGLEAVRPFEPEKQILEYRIRREGGRWEDVANRLVSHIAMPPN